MFGKLMSISDQLMWRYYELLTDLTMPEIAALQRQVQAGQLHPMEAKKTLAGRIVADFHSAAQAKEAAENWARQFQRDEVPENIEDVSLQAGEFGAPDGNGRSSIKLDKLLVRAGLAGSASDAQRKIKAGSVRIDGQQTRELFLHTALPAQLIIRVGRLMKRIALS